MTAVRAWRAPVSIAILVIALDQLTKHWAVTSLGTDREIHVFWTLQFNLGFNNGMAFGQGQGFGPLIAVVATVVIVYLLVTLRKEASRMSTIGMGLLIGGAAGNLIDRLLRGDEGVLRGAVVDFIDFQWFPIFNIADCCVVLGTILMGKDLGISEELVKFDNTIKRMNAMWKMALATQKMNKLAGMNTGDEFARIKTEAAVDSVMSGVNKAFAEMETEMMVNKKAPALTNDPSPALVVDATVTQKVNV